MTNHTINTINTLSVVKPTHSLTGGVHMFDNKAQSTATEIETCPLPQRLLLPLNMHSGADAKVVVEIGEVVTKHQIIAEASGPVSAYIHSPVNGIVADIKLMPVINRSELEEMVVVIDVNQQSQQTTAEDSSSSNNSSHNRNTENPSWTNYSNEELLLQIEKSGIVGLGGAGFPTHQKIISSNANCHTLLLNGAECEPYISCDDLTMREHSSDILEGALILAKMLQLEKIQIAIEDNKPEAINAMTIAIQKIKQNEVSAELEMISIPAIYPSGGEKQLIEIITGKQVTSKMFPASLGYIVQNIGTILAVYNAVIKETPLIERIVTVTGEAIGRPGNYRVTLGTPIRHLLDFAGWNENDTKAIVHGGPMMGYPLSSADLPIVKSSNCIIAATAKEFPEPEVERPCIRCGQCADVCPASLLPQQLFWYSQSGELNKAEDYNIMDCIECGACEYVCPSQIPLVDYYRFTKGEIKTRADITEKAERSKVRFDFRNERLENIKIEKAQLKAERTRIAAENRKNKDANSETSSDTNVKKDLVAEALARVEAKKKAKAAAMKKLEGKDDV
jgi:electron transport complex protein RnfC